MSLEQRAQPVWQVAAKKGAFDPTEFAKTLPGITEPLGFFDPLGPGARDSACSDI